MPHKLQVNQTLGLKVELAGIIYSFTLRVHSQTEYTPTLTRRMLIRYRMVTHNCHMSTHLQVYMYHDIMAMILQVSLLQVSCTHTH